LLNLVYVIGFFDSRFLSQIVCGSGRESKLKQWMDFQFPRISCELCYHFFFYFKAKCRSNRLDKIAEKCTHGRIARLLSEPRFDRLNSVNWHSKVNLDINLHWLQKIASIATIKILKSLTFASCIFLVIINFSHWIIFERISSCNCPSFYLARCGPYLVVLQVLPERF